MSSIWTPGGEHPVDPHARRSSAGGAAAPADRQHPADQAAEQAELEAELAEARRRLAETPARVVVANHAIGLFQLAALHLDREEPHLAEAQLAIDAMGALVEGLGGRLGDEEQALRDALAQIRLAFVHVRGAGARGGQGAQG